MFERLCVLYRCQFVPCLMSLLPISRLLVVRSFVYQLWSVVVSALRLFGIPSCSSLCVECVEGDWNYKLRANADAKFTERALKLTPVASLWNPDRLDAQMSPTLCTCTLVFSLLVEGR